MWLGGGNTVDFLAQIQLFVAFRPCIVGVSSLTSLHVASYSLGSPQTNFQGYLPLGREGGGGGGGDVIQLTSLLRFTFTSCAFMFSRKPTDQLSRISAPGEGGGGGGGGGGGCDTVDFLAQIHLHFMCLHVL